MRKASFTAFANQAVLFFASMAQLLSILEGQHSGCFDKLWHTILEAVKLRRPRRPQNNASRIVTKTQQENPARFSLAGFSLLQPTYTNHCLKQNGRG
jgi:hypothetical protein